MKRIPDDDDDDDDDDAAVFISELVSPRLIINPVTSVKFRVAVHFSTRPASFQPNHLSLLSSGSTIASTRPLIRHRPLPVFSNASRVSSLAF